MKLKTVTLLVLSLLTCGAMADSHKHNHSRGEHRQEQRQDRRYDGRRDYNRDYQRPIVRTQHTTRVVVQPSPWYETWYTPRPRPVYVEPRRTVVVAPRPWYVVVWPW